jgi:hypothetical protein
MTSVCTMCGHVGEPKSKRRGSFVICFLLFCLGGFPGLIYLVWMFTSKDRICPSCKMSTMIPATSPRAQEMITKSKPPATP